jgi:hypothetical protein
MEKQFSLLELIASVMLRALRKGDTRSKCLNGWGEKKGKVISIKIQADKFFPFFSMEY